MTKKRFKWVIFIIGILILIFWYIGSKSLFSHPSVLEVIFLNVGQGDASLIKTPYGQTILIDGGPDNLVLWRLGENLPFYRRQIDFVIFSHYHDDHLTGLVEVLRRYRVNNIVYAPTAFSSPILDVFWEIVAEKKITVHQITASAQFNLAADCRLDLLNPEFLNIPSDENNSLSVRLSCANQNFLFTGDSGVKAEKALLASGWPLTADVLKAAHHGSNSANSWEFLQAVNPDLLVISAGRDNRFGHPHPAVIDRAHDLGINILSTIDEGNIIILK